MRIKIKHAGTLLLGIMIISLVYATDPEEMEDDAIVIEADDSESPREKRNVPYHHRPVTWADALGEGSPCLTSSAVLGSCTSFRTCYPYVKIPNISIWESWVLGNYDTCSYFTSGGLQTFGVCCTNPITPIPFEGEDIPSGGNQVEEESGEPGNIKDSKYQNWPPPIPTHPPASTQKPYPPTTQKPSSTSFQWPPPIPTHPPDHSYPTHPTGSLPTVTTTTTSKPWTTKPPTSYPSYPWPPPIPTHPPHSETPTTQRPFTSSTMTPTTSTTLDDGTFTAACGAKNGFLDQERIVGGQNASPNEWPWVVVLFNNGRQFCGGSLIDNKHILTAAHCVAHMSSWDVARLKVHLGDHNIRATTEVKHIERKIKRVVRHRGFDFRTLYHDVAVLTMDQPVQFTKTVRPICFPSGAKGYSGKVGTVAGWGSLRENGPQPAILQKVSVPIWSNKECAKKYGAAAPGGIIEGMVCAGQAAKDSCSGDSGGPLMVNDGRWTQVGVVSWGIGCGKGQYPGVYTRVTHYLPWIKKNLSQ